MMTDPTESEFIDKLTKADITLRSKEVVPVSKSRYAEVADRYMDYRLG